MECRRALVPTPEGRMKVMDKTGEEYAEAMIRAEKASTRSFENSPVNYMPDIPTVIRVWGTLPDYEKWREKQEENQRRQILYRMYPTWKVNLVLSVERAWKHYKKTGDFNLIHKRVNGCVNYWAGYYGRKYSRYWLCTEDFESVFWLAVKQAADQHSGYDIYFYVGINNKLRNRGKDVLRMRLGTRQGNFEHSLKRIPVGFDAPSPLNVEKEVTDRELVSQLLIEPSLNQQERELLYYLYENHDASFQEIADFLGFNHREKARRLLQRIAKKLELYRDVSLAC